MENINWKEKADEIIEEVLSKNSKEESYDIVDAMIDFAKLACEEQKKICAKNALIDEEAYEHDDEGFLVEENSIDIDRDSILNSPTVNFD